MIINDILHLGVQLKRVKVWHPHVFFGISLDFLPGPESPLSMSLRLSLARECSDGSSLGSGPQLRRRASIVAAKSFKSDGREASVETQPGAMIIMISLGDFLRMRSFLIFLFPPQVILYSSLVW